MSMADLTLPPVGETMEQLLMVYSISFCIPVADTDCHLPL